MLKRPALFLGLALLLPACGGSSGGGSDPAAASAFLLAVLESEPNNTPASASPLPAGGAGQGDLTNSTDVDYWKFSGSAGQVISIELFGARLDPQTWDSNNSIPLLTLLEPNGTTAIVRHDAVAWENQWSSWHDLDIARAQLQVTGTFFIRVYPGRTVTGVPTSGGKYALVVKTLDIGSVQLEQEGIGVSGLNEAYTTAEPIVPGTIRGWHKDSDEDYYSFDITGPTVVNFEMSAYRNGVYRHDTDYFDTYIYLYDTDGTSELTHNDDSFWYDSSITYHFTTAGTYFIHVSEYGGNTGDRPYWLTFTSWTPSAATETESNDTSLTANPLPYGSFINADTAAADVDFFSFDGQAGDIVYLQMLESGNGSYQGGGEVTVTFMDTDGTTPLSSAGPNGGLEIVRTMLQSTGTFFIRASYGGTAGPYSLQLTLAKRSTYETEPNDLIAQAGSLDANLRAAGVIDITDDADFFTFTASAKELVTLSIFARTGNFGNGFFNLNGYGSQLKPRLTILDAVGGVMATAKFSPPSGNVSTESIVYDLPTFELSFIAPVAGTYVIKVEDESGTGAADRYYVVEKR